MTDKKAELGELYDGVLLDLVRNGRKIITEDGQEVSVPLSAADLNVIRGRLKDCGITAIQTEDNPIGNIAAEFKQRGLKLHTELPDINKDDDVATQISTGSMG